MLFALWRGLRAYQTPDFLRLWKRTGCPNRPLRLWTLSPQTLTNPYSFHFVHFQAGNEALKCSARDYGMMLWKQSWSPTTWNISRPTILTNAGERPTSPTPRGRLARAIHHLLPVPLSPNQKSSCVMTNPQFQNRAAASVQTQIFPKGSLFMLKVQQTLM